MQLPEPTNDALAASRALVALIVKEIQAQEGWISFARFMELALYAKGLGYYAGGSAKLGKEGDFTTAPEITPLFGATLAKFAADLAGDAPIRILEFGAGSGKLARDVLVSLNEFGQPAEDYAIDEISSQLRQRQQALLANFPVVRWLNAAPSAFSGLVLCNEVLDAMPVQLIVKSAGLWWERGVTWQKDMFVFSDKNCDPQITFGIPDAQRLPDGYVTEVHPVQEGFVRTLGDMLGAGNGGAAVLIDYGFPAHEYYLAQRNQGTLMCHYRHHAHADPFFHVGLQDITAHVDFTAIARAAIDSGLSVMGYMNQAAFLLSAGLPDLMQKISPGDIAQWFPAASAVQKLTSPAEMGELFKVLIIGAGLTLPEPFILQDRSYRL